MNNHSSMHPEFRQPEPSDEELAGQVVRHDLAAFALLYDRYGPPVYATAAHMLGPADAEEVVQEAFLRLWKRAHQYDRARGLFRPWFMTIARHCILDELRARSQQQRLVAAVEIDQLLAGDAHDPAVDVEQTVRRREENAAVRHALRMLPAEQRRALVLAYFAGLSQSSIAQQLGWPLGTVKKRIRLGLQKLRAALAPGRLAEPVTESNASPDVT